MGGEGEEEGGGGVADTDMHRHTFLEPEKIGQHSKIWQPCSTNICTLNMLTLVSIAMIPFHGNIQIAHECYVSYVFYICSA